MSLSSTTAPAPPAGPSTEIPHHGHVHVHTTDPVIEWSTHSFCSYSICRAAIPFRESVHEPHNMSIHFAHSRTSSSSSSTDSATVPHSTGSSIGSGEASDTETRKPSVITNGRDEWLDVEKEDGEGGERLARD